MAGFAGFPEEAVWFLRDLKANNDHGRLKRTEQICDRALRVPAERFCDYQQITGGGHAPPRAAPAHPG